MLDNSIIPLTQHVNGNIKFVFKVIYRLLCVCSVVEICIFPSVATLLSIVMCFVGVFILQQFHLKAKTLILYPVSTVAIMMYVVFFLVLPMPATLIEFKPLIYNLHNPYETFANVLLLESVLILSQKTYIKLSGGNNIVKRFLLKTPAYSELTSSELWLLIIASCILHTYVIMSFGLYTEDSDNINRHLPPFLYVLNLLIAGFQPLIFLFLFRKFNVIKNKDYKIHYVPIFAIAALLFLVGVATNMRTVAVQTVSVALFLFVYYWFFFLSKKSFKLKQIIGVLLMAWFFFGPFMNISKAMVLVRGSRAGLSGQEVLEMTFSGLAESKQAKKADNTIEWGYSEKYLDNDILNRFCSVKILDETLFRAHEAGYQNQAVNEKLQRTLLSYIPRALRGDIDIKIVEEEGSLTDVLAVQARSATTIGGVKIGTLQGLGLALYGWWYIPIIFFLYIVIFYLLDSTACFYKGRMRFSWIFLCSALAFCYWFSDRHYYVWEYRFLLRGFVEMVFFSCATVFLIKHIPFIKH